MSASLQWQLIRNNSSFVLSTKKYGEKQLFSTEPGNLMNKHSFKYSGLANAKAVDVSPLANGKGVVITTKNKAAASKPKTGYTEVPLEVKGARPTFKAVRGLMGKSFYRADLEAVSYKLLSAM